MGDLLQIFWLFKAICQDQPKNRHAREVMDKCEIAALNGSWVSLDESNIRNVVTNPCKKTKMPQHCFETPSIIIYLVLSVPISGFPHKLHMHYWSTRMCRRMVSQAHPKQQGLMLGQIAESSQTRVLAVTCGGFLS